MCLLASWPPTVLVQQEVGTSSSKAGSRIFYPGLLFSELTVVLVQLCPSNVFVQRTKESDSKVGRLASLYLG